MIVNPQYDYDYGPNGPLAALQDRAVNRMMPAMIAPPIGWVDLVVQLDRDLAEILPDYTIYQVKEKFGGLRFYVDNYGAPRDSDLAKQAQQMIAEAESKSSSMCQICGQDARVRTEFAWYGAFCDDHATTEALRLVKKDATGSAPS